MFDYGYVMGMCAAVFVVFRIAGMSDKINKTSDLIWETVKQLQGMRAQNDLLQTQLHEALRRQKTVDALLRNHEVDCHNIEYLKGQIEKLERRLD